MNKAYTSLNLMRPDLCPHKPYSIDSQLRIDGEEVMVVKEVSLVMRILHRKLKKLQQINIS